MKIIHSINNHQIEKKADENENIEVLLTNSLGGYAAFGRSNDSRYNGWFVSLHKNLYKIIDDIKLQDNKGLVSIKNNFYAAERSYESDICEKIFFPKGKNSLVYELNKECSVEIVLDVRASYDSRTFGRIYEIFEEDGVTIIKYAKYKNWEEDKSEGKEFDLYIAINAGGGKIEKIGEWAPKHYGYDEKRSSQPFDKYVYKALKISAKKIVFSTSFDKEKAKSELMSVFINSGELEARDKKRLEEIAGDFDGEEEVAVASAAAKCSLDSLIVEDGNKTGVMAGLPWFFQFWTSDESICLKSVSEINKKLARKILLRDIKYINNDGKTYDIMDAKKAGQLTLNMDAAGWLFKRAFEMLKESELNKKDIKTKLATTIENLRKNFSKDGLIHCDAGETWMDTFYAGDLRDGARIEIQALMLSMYKIAFNITLDEKYKVWEHELKENVRRKFWNGKILADGLGDWTIRPNIFIAYYIYPELLTNLEWKGCFKEALSHLWLGWGGIATVDKTSSIFYNEYTGETSESYHRGDSWYWINNLAALAFYRVDEYVFRDYISKIMEASTRELLWHGVIGHMSELSSAKEQRPEGAWAQAWSAAMYSEAVKEIMKPQESLKVNVERTLKNKVHKPMIFETKAVNKPFVKTSADRAKKHHKHLVSVYEVILITALLLSSSAALGTVAYAVTF